MKFAPETFAAFEGMLQSFKESGYLWGLPGRAEGSGRFTLQATEPGKVYVRILNEANQIVSLTTAVNLGANLDPSIKVRMEYIKGQLTIINPDPRDAANAYGNRASQAAVPPHSGALGGGNDDYIDSQRFTPGLVTASPVGGMFVRIYAFRYQGVYVATQDWEIPSGSIPTNPAETRLTLISYNPTLNDFEVDDGSLSFSATTAYGQSDVDAISIAAGNVPLAAVTLYEGMTTLLAALVRILDARQFLDPNSDGLSGYPDFGIQDTVSVVAGVLDISAATSRNIVVAGESGASDSVTQVVGLGDGQSAIFVADAGDTITFISSSDINLYNGVNLPINGTELLWLIGRGSDVVTQPLDEVGAGGGGFPRRATMWHDESISTAGASLTRNSVDTNASYNTRTFRSTAALNDEFTNGFFIADDSYTFALLAGRTGNDSGILTIEIDGVSQGTIDLYTVSFTYNVIFTLTATVLTDGWHTLTVRTTSKNGASSGYQAVLTKFWLYPSAD